MVRLIRLFTTTIILSAGILTGCASVKMASQSEDAKAKTFATNPQQANVYVYRNEFIGAALSMAIELDGKEIGKTGPKSYFLLGLEPGHHTLVSKAENDSLLNLITEAGKNYYVWQEVKMGLLLARSKLQLMSEAEGQAGVRESKLLEVNGASPVASVPVTKSEVATKPVEKTISQPAPDSVVVAKQAEPIPAATVNASLPSPAPVTSNNITKIERVPFEIGVSSVTVERIAKQNSCQSTKGAGLLYKKGPVEVYRVQCEDGREIKARCEMRQCEIFTP
nr:DUF2846 domain-containing protein [uncultured Undibacterium sp.]